MRGPAAAALLGRALSASAHAAGATVEIDTCEAETWFSATFSGTRYALALTAPDEASTMRWLSALPSQDLPLAGHLLAELSVAQVAQRAGRLHLRIDALTVAAA
jgi:hypothetical protein